MADVRVKRWNVELVIREEDKERYLAEGFDVIDNTGKMIQSHTGSVNEQQDIKALQDKVKKLEKEKKTLETKLKKLQGDSSEDTDETINDKI